MLRQLFNTFVSQKEEITADEKLESSELRYRRLFETAQDGILILDGVSGKIDDVNPFLYELLGYLPGELIGKQLWEIGVFKDIAASKDAFEQLRARGYIRYNDLPLQTKDGRTINVEFVSNTYLVDNQKVVQCNVRDVTNRKKAEESVEARTRELEILNKTQEKTKSAMINVMEDLENERNGLTEAKAKNEAMLASIGDGFAIANEKGRLIYFNNFASDILGIDANQGLPDTWQKEYGIFDPVTLKPYPTDQMPLFLAVNGQAVNKVQLFIRNHKIRNGKYITVTATPIIMKGKSIGGVAIFRDTTQEREIDRAKSEFVSLASHQLRTPLGIMKWHLEALEDENYTKKAPSSIRNYLDAINKSNERLLSLVGDLLSVSRIDQGQVKNAPESVDIVKAVKEVVAQLRIVALKKKVALRVTLHGEKIPAIMIDSIRLHEVIENLIINAIEYTNALGQVDVILEKKGDTLLMRVKDTGIGISPDDEKKIFTKFFRSEKAVAHNPEGSGLGLYVVKSYVEGWGGKLTVKGRLNKGSTFSVSLPMNLKL